MPFILVLFGILFVVAGVRGTWRDFLNLLKGDFVGANNFLFWLVAIVAIGSLGYIPRVRPISDALLVLVILVIFLAHKGFFGQFQGVIKSTEVAPADTTINANAPMLGGIPLSQSLLSGVKIDPSVVNLGAFIAGE